MIDNLKWHIVVGIEYKNTNYFLYVPHISRTYRCMFVLYTNVCLCMCVFVCVWVCVCLCVFGFVHEGGHLRNICVYYFMYMNIIMFAFFSININTHTETYAGTCTHHT